MNNPTPKGKAHRRAAREALRIVREIRRLGSEPNRWEFAIILDHEEAIHHPQWSKSPLRLPVCEYSTREIAELIGFYFRMFDLWPPQIPTEGGLAIVAWRRDWT